MDAYPRDLQRNEEALVKAAALIRKRFAVIAERNNSAAQAAK